MSLVKAMLCDLMAQSFMGTPENDPTTWAGENVYLSAKETPNPQFYNPDQTPWVKRGTDCVLLPEVKQVTWQKSSRSGVTESCLNVARWMPDHMPGPVLYAINSADKAREVSSRRLIPHYKSIVPHLLTGDPDDISKQSIKLQNMEVTVSGSGGAGVFMEGWYLVIILDELEDHSQEHEDSTIDRSLGRQTTVDNSTLYAIGKPQLVGGPINSEYMRGSQEKFHVPCPRCGTPQELIWDFVSFGHCRKKNGEWDLDRVLKDTFYQCRHCKGRIEEHEKWNMNLEGVYVPEVQAARGGVQAEEGHVSLHISDLYADHPKVKWGKLAEKYLAGCIINPEEGKRKFFWTNHLGLAWEVRKAQMKQADIERLKGGIVEEDEDGNRMVIGEAYRWSYEDGVRVDSMPINPRRVTMTVDKQGECLKFVVFAWSKDWQGYPIDYGTQWSEEAILELFENRKYLAPDGKEWRASRGLIDCGFKQREVFRICLKSNAKLYPCKGQGESDQFRGKSIKERKDKVDGRWVLIYDFYNHEIESDFYLGKIKSRSVPRLWMPENMGDEFGRELCSAKLIVQGRREKWDKDRDIPNDWGDTCKMQYILKEILMGGVT